MKELFDLINKRLDSLQELVLQLATNVAEHKKVISFLVNHTTFNKDSTKDFTKLLKEIDSLNKKVKEK